MNEQYGVPAKIKIRANPAEAQPKAAVPINAAQPMMKHEKVGATKEALSAADFSGLIYNPWTSE